MPRRMPDFVGGLQDSFLEARDFVDTVERIRRQQSGRIKTISTNKVRFGYELAYLRAFAAWENFLEASFLRYLCGYCSSAGQQTIRVPHVFCATVSAAETLVLDGRRYKLWHNPRDVIGRSQTYFLNGRHETVLSSVLSRVDSFAAVRHHIAHQRRDTATQFDSACINLCGYRSPGSRAGSFLRKRVSHVSPSKRWFDLILSDLEAYAVQIVP